MEEAKEVLKTLIEETYPKRKEMDVVNISASELIKTFPAIQNMRTT